MTILHVSTPVGWRGGEQQVANLSAALTNDGIIQVILCPEGSALADRMMNTSVPVTTFPKRGLLNLAIATKIHKLCREGHFDIIHCHDAHAHTAAVLAASFFKTKIPLVVSRRVNFPISSSPLSKWKYNHPAVKKIICVSFAVREMASRAIRDKSTLAVVHSGIDPEKYSTETPDRKLLNELFLDPTTTLIGNIGALDRHKDYNTFIHTAALIRKTAPSTHFIIAGKGPEEHNIRKLIKTLNLTEHVHLLGFREDVADVLQSLDLFLMTTISEGLGTIILEAFAAGVPVVATRTGGIPEMVEDEVTGLLSSPGDINTFASATLRILKDPALKKQLIENAKTRVTEFSYQATAQKTAAIYREVLQGHR